MISARPNNIQRSKAAEGRKVVVQRPCINHSQGLLQEALTRFRAHDQQLFTSRRSRQVPILELLHHHHDPKKLSQASGQALSFGSGGQVNDPL